MKKKIVDNSAFSWIRDRLTPGLLIAAVALLIKIMVIADTRTFTNVETKVDTEKLTKSITDKMTIEEWSKHQDNEEIHKPYAVMNELWVPRYEIDSLNLENIKYMNQLSTQIDATNRMVVRTNRMVQEFIKSQEK